MKNMQCLRCERDPLELNSNQRLKRGYCNNCYQILRNNGSLSKLERAAVPNELSQFQLETLEGLMLGDGCLHRQQNKTCKGAAKLQVDRSIKDKDYLFDNYSVFSDFCSSKPRYYKRHEKYEGYVFATKQAQVFNGAHDRWYPNGTKIVPKDLVLTPLIVAIWFCDDGSIYSHKDNRPYRMRLQLATNGFSKIDNEFLVSSLEEILGEKMCISYDYKGQYRLTAADNTTRAFIEYIDDVFPSTMVRKCYWKTEAARYYDNPPPYIGLTSQNVSYKMSQSDIKRLLELKTKMSYTELSDIFGVSRAHLNRIVKSNKWIGSTQ